ncbi:MAG: NADH-quinone oxidoreductase subunit I [Myxococcales bacterium]|nr:NADH-quinone oxidoreductase subunit I [Myxococcales bacterium]
MSAAREYFAAIRRAVFSLADGLSVTVSYLLRRPVTIQYPDRTAQPVQRLLPERSRGLLEVDVERCTACGLCAKTCPIDCIVVETGKDAAGARLHTRMDVDLGRCMFCGLCVEACPTGAIRHSREFEGGMARVENLLVRFLDAPRPPAKPPKKGEEPPEKPAGSIIRSRLPGAFAPARRCAGGPDAKPGGAA